MLFSPNDWAIMPKLRMQFGKPQEKGFCERLIDWNLAPPAILLSPLGCAWKAAYPNVQYRYGCKYCVTTLSNPPRSDSVHAQTDRVDVPP